MNGHLESFGVAKGRLVQLFLFASMTEPLDPAAIGGAPRWGVTPSDPMGTTMRRIDAGQGGHRIVTRNSAVVRPGLRPTQGDLTRAARAHAWLKGRDFVSPDDVQAVAADALRHRLLLSFEAEANGITPDQVISELLSLVPVG